MKKSNKKMAKITVSRFMNKAFAPKHLGKIVVTAGGGAVNVIAGELSRIANIPFKTVLKELIKQIKWFEWNKFCFVQDWHWANKEVLFPEESQEHLVTPTEQWVHQVWGGHHAHA